MQNIIFKEIKFLITLINVMYIFYYRKNLRILSFFIIKN